MTNEQREKITALRREGWGYKKISAALCISANTVKSFCRRESLGGILAIPTKTDASLAQKDQKHCKQCKADLTQIHSRRSRKFCSAACRIAWWNTHPEELGTNKIRSFSCQTCGLQFNGYGPRERKYCTRGCYGKSKTLKP